MVDRGPVHSDVTEPKWRAPVALSVSAGVFGSFLAYYGLLCFRHEGWGGDFQMYCAGISRLYQNFWRPMHEAMDAPGTQSTVYTAYLVVLAAFGKLFGASEYRTLEVAGLFNLFVYCAAVAYLFSRHSLHRRWWLAAACFMFASLFIRWLHFGWSSETSLTNFQYVQPFPSTFGWSLGFFAFGLMEELSRKRRWQEVLGLGLVLAASLTTHVLTASWVLGIVALHALWVSAARRDPWLLPRPLAAMGIGIALAALWPYAPLFGQRGMSNVKEGAGFGGSPFHDIPNLYALAIPCFAYLIARLRRHAFWLLGMLVTLLMLAIWNRIDFYFGYRYAFYAAFFAQFAVAEVLALGIFALLGPVTELSTERRWQRLDRPVVLALSLAALLAWLPSPMFAQARKDTGFGRLLSPMALLRLQSPHDAYYRQFSEIRAQLSPSDLVLTPVTRAAFDLATITDSRVVSSPNALQVPDRFAKQRDVNRFFDKRASAAERAAVVRRHRPTKLVLPGNHRQLEGALTQQFGKATHEAGGFLVWSLPALGQN